MKKKQTFLQLLAVLLFLGGTISGCFNRSISNSIDNAKTGEEIFLITKKGQKIKGSSIKVNRFVKNNGSLTLDGKTYAVEDVLNYQSKDGFFTNFNNSWYQRIHKGTVEAFIRTTNVYTAGSTTSKTTAYLSKNQGELKDYTSENLLDLVSDNKSAVEVFNAHYGKAKDKTPWDYQYKKLLTVLASYK